MTQGSLAIESMHIPVMVGEVLDALKVREGGLYIDCTVGAGGHASAILCAAGPGSRLLGMDVDPNAIERSASRLDEFRGNFLLANENFTRAEEVAVSAGFNPVDGILFDLGVSSDLLGDPQRGLSFQHDSPLDMRFSDRQQVTAADLVNDIPESELADILFQFGQERHSRRIARMIIANRPVLTTGQLARLVERSLTSAGRNPHKSRIHPATRTFMALRIAVNREMDSLASALPQGVRLLKPQGRLVVISFHSLEDGMVKGFLRRESSTCICPPQLPQCICGHSPSLKTITKEPIYPTEDEIRVNPRSRSAKMRVAQKL
ncbi:MAG: 16S rRNA (cytosine(1402)-N(4))-methyltransferase RsmH [Dehalococcoidia bacterium]|nr:16S rRNA (cytosine(1402)-N(4))-methyltransferase RsmH [Dehalococcoidia bacterium]